MRTTDKIDDMWSTYDKAVGECHLGNYGVIYLDDFGRPIDDFETLDEILKDEKKIDLKSDLLMGSLF